MPPKSWHNDLFLGSVSSNLRFIKYQIIKKKTLVKIQKVIMLSFYSSKLLIKGSNSVLPEWEIQEMFY